MKGSLRIRSAPTLLSFNGDDISENKDSYLSRLVKLIPGEVLSLYMMGENVIPKEETLALAIFSIVCVGLVYISRSYTTQNKEGSKPQYSAVIISMISFCIWVYATGGIFVRLDIHQTWLATLMIGIWQFLVPYIYKGD